MMTTCNHENVGRKLASKYRSLRQSANIALRAADAKRMHVAADVVKRQITDNRIEHEQNCEGRA